LFAHARPRAAPRAAVCHCHFHDLYPDYAAICAKHGVRLNTRPNILAAWRSCVARVFELSAER